MSISISPTLSAILNVLLSVLSGVASTQVTDASGAKSTLVGVAAAGILNAVLHGFSSPAAGPVASTPTTPAKS